jgi:hypothetical protein
MPTTPRDRQFAAFAAAHRLALLGTALLMSADPQAAAARVHTVLARLYAAWPRTADPVRQAYAAAVGRSVLAQSLPWHHPRRFELVDEERQPGTPGGLLADLARLDTDDRRVLVLRAYARLPVAEVSAATGLSAAQVAAAETRATDQLAQGSPARRSRPALQAELAAAAQAMPEAAGPDPAADDHSAGRRLLLRRRASRVGATAALLGLLLIGVRAVLPLAAPEPAAAPVPVTSSPTPPCDTTQQSCRAELVADWRNEMAAVISSHLDPGGRYFTAASYSAADSEASESFWADQGGALALDLFRAPHGATQVSLQIATSREEARRCGDLTGRSCFSMRFMDGNRFILTDTGSAELGVEVQHRPTGTYVITLSAREVGSGRTLPVTTGDLMALAQDARLQLPPR